MESRRITWSDEPRHLNLARNTAYVRELTRAVEISRGSKQMGCIMVVPHPDEPFAS